MFSSPSLTGICVHLAGSSWGPHSADPPSGFDSPGFSVQSRDSQLGAHKKVGAEYKQQLVQKVEEQRLKVMALCSKGPAPSVACNQWRACSQTNGMRLLLISVSSVLGQAPCLFRSACDVLLGVLLKGPAPVLLVHVLKLGNGCHVVVHCKGHIGKSLLQVFAPCMLSRMTPELSAGEAAMHKHALTCMELDICCVVQICMCTSLSQDHRVCTGCASASPGFSSPLHSKLWPAAAWLRSSSR